LILVDTNVLVALVDEHDDLGPRATRDLKRLRTGRFAITAPILGEAFFLLPRAYLRKRLRFVLERLSVAVVEMPAAWWDDVFDWMERYQGHEPDLADAELATLCSKKPDYTVWTYDDEFRTIWRRKDGSRIPLAARATARR
jgi:predicted nucleic acid-binding protein